MRSLFSKPSEKQFKIEPEWKLKIKEIIRDFRRKNLFYLEHSRFATYIDPDYLSAFNTEIIAFSKKHIREQTDMNMSAENPRGKETHASTRGLHVQDVAVHSHDVAEEELLNEELARIGGGIHDLGHAAYAHLGEQKLSKYLTYHGIAEVHHAILARYVVEVEEIHEKTLERLAKKKKRPLTKRELAEYNRDKLIIADIAAAHNGEGLDEEIVAKLDKTDAEMEEEFINAFVIPKFDRKIVAKTPEAAIVRFIDPISYVAKDFRDGVIAGVISVHDPEYEALFREMGVPDEVFEAKHDKKDRLVRAVTYALRDDLEKNSRGINGARMSSKMAKLMYKLRDLNYEKAVKPRTKKITNILSERLPYLLDRYTDHLIQYGDYTEAEDGTYLKKFLKTIKEKEPKKVGELCSTVVKRGIEESVRREVNAVLSGQESGMTVRRKRIQSDLDRLRQNGEITDEVKEKYIQRVLKEIYLSTKQSKQQFIKYLTVTYPDKSQEEIQELANQNPEMRFETYEECLARFRATLYIGMSSNTYVLEMLKEEGLLSKEEEATRYEFGGEDESVIQTKKEQEELRREMEKKKQDPEEPGGQEGPEL